MTPLRMSSAVGRSASRERGTRRRRTLAGLLIVSSLAAGCSMLRGGDKAHPAAAKDAPPAAGQVAVLVPIGGSAISGKVRVIDRGDGVAVLISAINVPRDFRIAFHETPNCSSPNGFSAGPAWAPPGKTPQNLVPLQHGNAEGRAEIELRVPGVRTTGANGVAGRSVVVYAGGAVTVAQSGVANDRIACGVFEPVRLLTF
jgi:Cu/Zn superoxide dismutase